MKTAIFLEAVLATDTMIENQYNLDQKTVILSQKNEFSSRINSSFFTSIAPELFQWSNETNFLKPLSTPSQSLADSIQSQRFRFSFKDQNPSI